VENVEKCQIDALRFCSVRFEPKIFSVKNETFVCSTDLKLCSLLRFFDANFFSVLLSINNENQEFKNLNNTQMSFDKFKYVIQFYLNKINFFKYRLIFFKLLK
jgi:hypothetical protein